ncbi:zinc transporter 1a [Corythoichthys intestinalis]|uniref:zinc transporter 1a n=1 Tax=Corythoichthys intestinalis TaxID=161448 RepID=UPI0025A63CA2|nr:zinc transporter 1a [Corythoichthys intestinalis]XP_061806878.1 proton-coupled zinc antiporter SLC30A1-like [Nerophis lumbriciformis]
MACEPNRVRLLCMLSLTFVFFIVEVVVSRITASLSMLSDSFHMLSDVIALIVALVAVRFSEKTQATDKNTFGWIRAEVMGALVNAVFLTALCCTIVLEAIERYTVPHEIERPQVLAGVGFLGLLVNLLGLCLFHGHAGGGHGHSHGGRRGKSPRSHRAGNGTSAETNNLVGNHSGCGDASQTADISPKGSSEVQINGGTQFEDLEHEHQSSAQLNMRGVFIHVLGDALGSVIVVINALIFIFVWKPCEDQECINPCIKGHASDHYHRNHTVLDMEGPTMASIKMAGPCWALYLDPTLCLIMVCIMLYTTYPLLKESALILLQRVPKQINIHRLNERLLNLDGVLAIHELHVWQLAGSRIIATAHIKCHDPTSYMEVAKRIKDFFHNEGIHATTIQPEFVTFSSESQDSLCELSCRTQCAPKQCCGSSDKPPTDRKTGSEPRSIDESPEVVALPQVQPQVIVTSEVESSL